MARFKEGSRAAAQEGTRNVAEVTFFDHMPPEGSAADTIVHVGVLVGPYTCHIMSQVFNESSSSFKTLLALRYLCLQYNAFSLHVADTQMLFTSPSNRFKPVVRYTTAVAYPASVQCDEHECSLPLCAMHSA